MKRTIESSSDHARYRADILLDTGKVIVLDTEWKPSHWQELHFLREQLIQDARKRAQHVKQVYGTRCTGIRVYKETRHTARVIEEFSSEKFHSLVEVAQ